MVNRVSERDRRSRDFTLNELRKAHPRGDRLLPRLSDLRPRPASPSPSAIAATSSRPSPGPGGGTPRIDATVFAFLQECAPPGTPRGRSAPGRTRLREAFVARFQQTTGPIQAKGLEDTTFYRQFKLASLNEVGGDPLRFGNSPPVFHAMNAQRLDDWPGGLSTTATHDTKRGEDARIRIDVLSELADEWRTHLARWSRINARKKAEVHDAPAPDAREEYLFYQALVGSWPFGGPDDAVARGLRRAHRRNTCVKAAREAKVNTSWTDTDPSYADALAKFVADVLEGPDAGPFLQDFLPFQREGRAHRRRPLALADPPEDRLPRRARRLPGLRTLGLQPRGPRQPPARRLTPAAVAMLGRTSSRDLAAASIRADLAARLLAAPDDGAIKLYLTWTALNHRKAQRRRSTRAGAYRPLEADGDRKANVVAFARHREGRYALAVAPRLVSGLMGDDARTPPVGRDRLGRDPPDPARRRPVRPLAEPAHRHVHRGSPGRGPSDARPCRSLRRAARSHCWSRRNCPR